MQSPTGDSTLCADTAEFTASENLEIHAGSTMAFGTDAAATIKGSDVTMSGSTANYNCGSAQAPPAPSTSPQEIPDPYGS